MQVFQMVFLIVLVMSAVQVVKIIYNAPAKIDQKTMDSIEERLARLEKRIENVETITTSKDYQLNREFEELVH